MGILETHRVAVVGASGYTGQELLRFLLVHPGIELTAVTSRQEAGRSLAEAFPRFAAAPRARDLQFVEPDVGAISATGATIAFLALPHGVAHDYAGPLLEAGLRVIDLSADFRLRDADVYEEFYGHAHPAPEWLEEAVYGLPEIHRDRIVEARLVASPGCYPTSILLPLIPLLEDELVDAGSLVASSASGASGAGKKADPSLLFVEVNESFRAYGAPKHRHLSEIEQELNAAAGAPVRLTFVPHLLPLRAGIGTTIVADLNVTPEEARDRIPAVYGERYGEAPFVRILGEGAFGDTKHVAGTNFLDIGWAIDERAGRLLVFSAEDNLGKGAAGQAVQSFNLMTGLPETTGLPTL